MKGATSTLERAYSLGHDGEIAAHWGEALWVSGNKSEARARMGCSFGARAGFQATESNDQAVPARCAVVRRGSGHS